MGKLQEEFNAKPAGDFLLTPGEYEGPLTISRPCVIDGAKSTLWAGSGPVLTIASPGVTVKNLRVEVTGSGSGKAGVAIQTSDPHAGLDQVEVNGSVTGFAGESESWDLPGILNLGEFAAGKVNTFAIRLNAPAEARLECAVNDLRVSPACLTAGENHLVFTTGELRHNTILYGELLVRTAVSRRIYVTGKAMKDAPVHDEALPVVSGPVVSMPVQVNLPADVVAPQVSDAAVQYLKRGQRISLKGVFSSSMKVVYEHQSAGPGIEMDCYCFALRDNGKVSRDEDLIFFGNPESTDHAVRTGTSGDNPLVMIDLEKVGPQVARIAVCYSIYGDDPRQNFSMVSAPVIRIFDGDKEVYRFELQDLSAEKTVVAAEVYRYKGEWKASFVGAGYKSGLKQLCEGYGVEVE